MSLREGNESLFAIRGVSVQGLSDNPNTFTAGVYVDDVALDNLSIRYGAMGVWDVEQIEVYRGPQGTLQGRAALTGAVIVKTRDPEYDWGGDAQVYYGEYGTTRLSVAGGGALIDDQLALRVAVDDYQSDGYVDNITRNEDDYAGFDRRTYRAKLLFEPTALAPFRALLTVARTDNDQQSNPNARADDPFSFDALSDNDAYNEILNDSASLNMSWQFSESLKLTSISTYVEDEYDRLDDFDSTAEPLGVIDQTGGSQSYTQELRLNFNRGNWSGVAGLYYADNKRDTDWDLDTQYAKANVEGQAYGALAAFGVTGALADSIWNTIPDLIDIQQLYDSRYDIENTAVFGEVTWRPAEPWAFTLGARYDMEDQERDQATVTTVSTVTGNTFADLLLGELANQLNTEPENTETDYEAFLPKFAAQYYWTDELNTAFTVQRGYRAGGTSVNIASGEILAYDPEYTWNYELALRSTWWDNRATVNANLFYTDWKDQQVDVSPTGDPRDSYIGNSGESELYGIEIEANAFVTSELEVYGNIGYVETEFKEFTLNVGGSLQDYSGNEFPDAPNLTAVLGANYRMLSGWFIGVDANYHDAPYLNNDNSLEADSRTLFNAKLGYEQERWSAYLWGQQPDRQGIRCHGVRGRPQHRRGTGLRHPGGAADDRCQLESQFLTPDGFGGRPIPLDISNDNHYRLHSVEQPSLIAWRRGHRFPR